MMVRPDDLLPLDQALAVVLIHNQQSQPWVIGPAAAVIDRAKRTIAYYAEVTLSSEVRGDGE